MSVYGPKRRTAAMRQLGRDRREADIDREASQIVWGAHDPMQTCAELNCCCAKRTVNPFHCGQSSRSIASTRAICSGPAASPGSRRLYRGSPYTEIPFREKLHQLNLLFPATTNRGRWRLNCGHTIGSWLSRHHGRGPLGTLSPPPRAQTRVRSCCRDRGSGYTPYSV